MLVREFIAHSSKVRQFLSNHPQVTVQLIKGHSGLPGNDAAHEAALSSASDNTNISTMALPSSVAFHTSKYLVNCRIQDPPPQHLRTAAVYIQEPDHSNVSDLARRDQVLLAQLRSGHCHKLAAYHNIIDPTSDPSCPRCKLAPHTLEHWLRECPATEIIRRRILDEVDPPLSILTTNPQQVILYARETLP